MSLMIGTALGKKYTKKIPLRAINNPVNCTMLASLS
jgi:hypothetical protein